MRTPLTAKIESCNRYLQLAAVLGLSVWFVISRVISVSQKQLCLNITKEVKAFFLIITVSFFLFFATIINNGLFSQTVQRVLAFAGPFLILCYGFSTDVKKTQDVLFIMFLILTAMVFISTIVLYPRGGLVAEDYGKEWLFGAKNTLRNIFFPAIAMTMIRDCFKGRSMSFSTVFIIVMSFISAILVSSGGTIISLLFLIGVVFVLKKPQRFDAISKIILCGCAFLDVMFLTAFGFVKDFLSFVSVNFIAFLLPGRPLGYIATLSGRTIVWQGVLSKIRQNFVLGNGSQGNSSEILDFRMSGGYQVTHAHNAVLDIIYRGGAIAAFAMLILLIICITPVFGKKNDKVAYSLLGLVLSAFFISGIIGELWNAGFFFIMFYCLFISKIDNAYTVEKLINLVSAKTNRKGRVG